MIAPRRKPAPGSGTNPMKNAALLVVLALSAVLGACERNPAPPADAAAEPAAARPTELEMTELKPGSGDPIENGSLAVVHYTGWLFDPAVEGQKGAKFDSSRDRGQPFEFTLGAGQVIKGWDRGVLGMRVGGERRLVIPAALGYGERGAGGVIPPGATLLFEVELLGIR
jgi:FKBP-type peptidyl-prolyl cis-trans isomerase